MSKELCGKPVMFVGTRPKSEIWSGCTHKLGHNGDCIDAFGNRKNNQATATSTKT